MTSPPRSTGATALPAAAPSPTPTTAPTAPATSGGAGTPGGGDLLTLQGKYAGTVYEHHALFSDTVIGHFSDQQLDHSASDYALSASMPDGTAIPVLAQQTGDGQFDVVTT